MELRQLKLAQPDLASAVDMQIALVDVLRRVQSRVPLPWMQVDPEWQRTQQATGRPLVRFRDIPLEWTDFRLTFRQTADILQRFDHALQPLVTMWYEVTSGVEGTPDPALRKKVNEAPAGTEQLLVLAIRPFLARCAEALAQRVDLGTWGHGSCPVCGWEPDFAVITPNAERRLICGRCLAQWPFPGLTCPFCTNDNRALITSFATRDGRYRVAACDVCRRYIKAYDARNAPRPLMVAVDTIATLPLDAAAMQKGYTG